MKNISVKSNLLAILMVPVLLGLNALSAGAAALSCSPGKVLLHANFGTASICIMGDSVNQFAGFALFKDEKLVKEIEVKPLASSASGEPRVTIMAQVVSGAIQDGSYVLKGNLKADKSKYITLPVEIKVNKKIPVKKPELKLAPFIKLENNTGLDAYRALAANNKPQSGFVYTPGQSVLNDPGVRRNMMLDAVMDEIAATMPKVKDWFPKTTGAQSGTLVIAGENLDQVEEVRIGDIALKPIQPSEYGSAASSHADKSRVYKLPEGPVQGELKWKRSGTSFYVVLERNYKTVQESGPDWPAIRTTYIGASNVFTGEDESVNNSLNRGRGDAMRLIHFQFAIEYIPGNVITQLFFPSDIPEIGVKGGERLAYNPVYSFSDASGNSGMFGNTVTVSFTTYVRDVNPSVNFEVRILPCPVSVESYQNTASLQNNKFNRDGVLNLEYNALKKYTMERTNSSEVRRLFDFQNTFAWGPVSGTVSNPDGSNGIEVGRVTVDGDIAFRLASTLQGAGGIWISPAFLMPHGWLIGGIGWSEKREFSNSQILAYGSEVEQNGIPAFQNTLNMISLCMPFCGGNGTHYNPGSGRAARLSSNVSKVKAYDGKSLSFGIKPLMIDVTNQNCVIKGPLYFNEPRTGQFVQGAVISLAADNNIDNSARVLMKLDYVDILGPHDADPFYMMRKVYLYDSNSFEPSQYDYTLTRGPIVPYPPSQLERYNGFPADYYMDDVLNRYRY